MRAVESRKRPCPQRPIRYASLDTSKYQRRSPQEEDGVSNVNEGRSNGRVIARAGYGVQTFEMLGGTKDDQGTISDLCLALGLVLLVLLVLWWCSGALWCLLRPSWVPFFLLFVTWCRPYVPTFAHPLPPLGQTFRWCAPPTSALSKGPLPPPELGEWRVLDALDCPGLPWMPWMPENGNNPTTSKELQGR